MIGPRWYRDYMPYSAQERRIRAAAKSRGIKAIRTKDLPGGEYAHVYVVRKAGPMGGHTIQGTPKKKKGSGHAK